jgi:hypothetical protein
MVDRGNRVYPDLICAVDLGSGGWVARERRVVAGRRRAAAHGGASPEAHRRMHKHGFPATVWDAVGLYAELRSRRTYLGDRGGGSSGHGGSQRKGEAAAIPARKRRRGGAVCARQTEGQGSSPGCDAQGEKNNNGETTSREIDDRRRSRKKMAALRAARSGDGGRTWDRGRHRERRERRIRKKEG